MPSAVDVEQPRAQRENTLGIPAHWIPRSIPEPGRQYYHSTTSWTLSRTVLGPTLRSSAAPDALVYRIERGAARE